MKQLALDVSLPAYAHFATFISNGNEGVLEALKTITEQPENAAMLYLHGLEATGKTHLLQACCHAVNNKNTSIYLDLAQEDMSPEVLHGWDHVALICLDNIDAVIDTIEWQESVFDLFNQRMMRDDGAQASLLVSASIPPSDLPIILRDLSSRLTSGLVFQLNALEEQYLSHALFSHAEQRGFEIARDTSEYLLKRLPRNLKLLVSIINDFDKASLEAQRKITIPFVKSVLD